MSLRFFRNRRQPRKRWLDDLDEHERATLVKNLKALMESKDALERRLNGSVRPPASGSR